MRTTILRQFATADASRTIHIQLPAGLAGDVEVIVLPAPEGHTGIPVEKLVSADLTDESGFAKDILASPEEDCWNDL